MATTDVNKIKSWLKVALKQPLENLNVNIDGTSSKGDGYSGDIIFVSLTDTNTDKNLSLVLKCSKEDEALRKTVPVKKCYLNEMYVYDKVFPTFTEFQLQRGITDVFSSVPKFYGSLCTETSEIIVLENLKTSGYTLWNKKKPLTRKHIEMVLSNYAKFHAVSIAMKDQQPKKFEEIANGLNSTYYEIIQASSWYSTFKNGVESVYNVLQGDLDEHILEKWKEFGDKIGFIFSDMLTNINGMKVIFHSDSWCNNFLFKYDNGDENLPLNVAILDWQMSNYGSPILDLSYFIFVSISGEDLESLEDILRYYYKSLREFVQRLGSDLNTLYPFEEFLNDWISYCKYGIAFSSVVLKVCASEQDEVIGLDETGGDFSASFSYDVKDKTCFKNRTRPIVEYVVKNKLI